MKCVLLLYYYYYYYSYIANLHFHQQELINEKGLIVTLSYIAAPHNLPPETAMNYSDWLR